ncbi:MAG: hypothetical protein ACT6Q8_24215 [Niveispirillum sp.]|uniref:hypothetical protein n=1 Tax=Niveispirillum sp. TaxID=1917217 RepID=UPI0040355A46
MSDILGTIYFAWVDDGEAYSPSTHRREDEQVFNLKISESEGEFPRAEVEIRSTGAKLLAAGRKRRAYISADFLDGAGAVTATRLLFAGRLTGIPIALAGATQTLELLAQPSGWQDILRSQLAALKTGDQWEPLLVSPDRADELDEVLAARPVLPHWDRRTGALSMSPIADGPPLAISAPLPTDITGHDADSLSISLAEAPIRRIRYIVRAAWLQSSAVTFDAADYVADALEPEPGPHIRTRFATLTPDALESVWSSPGIDASSGYEVIDARLQEVARSQVSVPVTVATRPTGDPVFDAVPTNARQVTFDRVTYIGRMVVRATYEQSREETLELAYESDAQDVLDAGEEVETLDLQDLSLTLGAYATDLYTLGPSISGGVQYSVSESRYIVPQASALYAQSGSGWTWSALGDRIVRHVTQRAVARLLRSARALEISCVVPLAPYWDISCAQALTIIDERLPGGRVYGKIISYEMIVEPDGCYTRLTIGAIIGRGRGRTTPGATASVSMGSYRDIAGGVDALSVGLPPFPTAGFAPPSVPVDAGQLRADPPGYLIQSIVPENTISIQTAAITGAADPQAALRDKPAGLYVTFRLLEGLETLTASATTASSPILVPLPRYIDLEG